MFDRLFAKRIICPYCLAENRAHRSLKKCGQCGGEFPVQYRDRYSEHKPFFVQVFGWSQVGKSVFLRAMTYTLVRMSNVWSSYSYAPITDASQSLVAKVNQTLAGEGKVPEPNLPGQTEEIYIMLLRAMQRWGHRSLVMQDCAGEIFDNLSASVEKIPFLIKAPTTFMLISANEFTRPDGRSMDMLLDNYITTLQDNDVDFATDPKSLVVVLTKGDIATDLPQNLRNYLVDDPIWAQIEKGNQADFLNAELMRDYVDSMEYVSEALSDWVQRDAAGKNFVRKARDHRIDIRFSVISSTGSPVEGGTLIERLSPRRVLDPFFWALEMQST